VLERGPHREFRHEPQHDRKAAEQEEDDAD
jgi:hypothetical protein